MEDDVHTCEKESRPKHWTRGKSFYPIIKGSKCKLIDIIEDKKEAGGGKCDDEWPQGIIYILKCVYFTWNLKFRSIYARFFMDQ